MRIRTLVPLLALLGSCSKSAPAPTAEPKAAEQNATPPFVAPPDVPRLTMAPPKTTITDRGTQELPANGMLRESDAVYVRAPTDSDWEPDHVRFSIAAPMYALAAYDMDKDAVYVRFSGKTAPATFDVSWETLYPEGNVSEKGVFHITTAKAKSAKVLRDDFFSALAATFMQVPHDAPGADSFYTYAMQRSAYISSSKKKNDYLETVDVDELMALYTGASSLHDALMSDLALRVTKPGKRTIPVSQVAAASLEAHPWEKLVRALGTPASIEPLAAVVPAGMIYLHAPSAKQLSSTVATLTDRLVGLVQAGGIDSGTGDVVERYARQLALEHSPAMAALADTAIDGIAIAASDPFFREGTDVTVAFHVTNGTIFKAGLAKKEQDIASRYQAQPSTYSIGNHTVSLTATADGTVNRHQLELGDVILVSNSRAALERFVQVQDGKLPSIAKGGDFAYMRALYPYGAKNEDTFCFIGDAFVAHVTSPAFKIAAARRVRALAETQAVTYAAMLYAWLEGHAPESTEAMIKAKVLEKNELIHEDGEVIAFDRNRGAHDKGAAAFARPLLEQTVDKVTPEERAAYDAFRQDYEQRWSKFVDPAALRIVSSGTSLVLDARLLPIASRGDYGDIDQLAGPARVKAPDVRNGVAWSGAVGPDAALRRDVEGTGQRFLGNDFQLGWLGDWVTAGMSDHAGLYDIAVASGALGRPSTLAEEEARAFVPPMWRMALSHAPLYVGAEVRNPVTFAALLTAVHKLSDEAAPGLIEWSVEDPFDGQPVTMIREGKTGAPDDQRIAIHYTTYLGAFIASLDRVTLNEQLTAIKEGRGPKSAGLDERKTPSTKPLGESAQITLDYAPADGGWLAKIMSALSERVRQLADLRAQAANDAVAPYLAGISDEAQRAAITYELLGYTPSKTDVTATTNLTKVRHVGARLSVEGRDEHRGLHTAVTLEE